MKTTEAELNNINYLVTMQWSAGNPLVLAFISVDATLTHTTHPNMVAAPRPLPLEGAVAMTGCARSVTMFVWVVCVGVASTRM